MVSNRSRGVASVGNQINQINSRLTKTENSPQSGLLENTVTGVEIAPESITNENIGAGAIEADSIARGAIGTEHLGIVNEINTDSSLMINIGGATGGIQLAGGIYTPPTTGAKALSVDSTGKVIIGLDSSELDTSNAALLNNTASKTRVALVSNNDLINSQLIPDTSSKTRTALTSATDVITTSLINGSSSTTRPAIKNAMATDLNKTFNPYGGIRVSNFDNLYALMDPGGVRPPAGTLIHVNYCDFNGQSGSHYGSYWRVTPGGVTVEPLSNVPILMANTTALAALGNAIKPGGYWSSRMSFDSMVSIADVASQQSGAPFRERWMWNSSNNGWFLHTGEGTYQLQFPGTVNHDTVESADNRTTVTRQGTTGILNLNVNVGSNGMGQGGAVLNVGPGYSAAGGQQFHFMVMIRNQGNNSYAWGDCYLSGQIVIFYQLSTFGSNGPQGSFGANSVMNGSLVYRANYG